MELPGGQAFGPVRPADVIDRELGSMDDDLHHLVDRKRPPGLDVADAVERRMVAADAGIEFQRDLERLETLPETIGQRREIIAVVGARESGAEAAIFALEHVLDAGVSAPRQDGAVISALGRTSG